MARTTTMAASAGNYEEAERGAEIESRNQDPEAWEAAMAFKGLASKIVPVPSFSAAQVKASQSMRAVMMAIRAENANLRRFASTRCASEAPAGSARSRIGATSAKPSRLI